MYSGEVSTPPPIRTLPLWMSYYFLSETKYSKMSFLVQIKFITED